MRIWFKEWKETGAEKWDGDMKVDLDFSSKNKWDTVDTTSGTFADETINLHPVGEDNDEITIVIAGYEPEARAREG